jgi:hypothetical protein
LSFSPNALAVFLREGYAGYVTLLRVLVVVLITSFLSSVGRLELLLFGGGTGALLQLQWGALCLCTLWGNRPPSTSRVADCHSVEELGFHLLDRRDVTLLQVGAM